MALSATQIRQVGIFDATVIDDVKILGGVAANATATGLVCEPSTEMVLCFLLPDAATTTYSFTVPEKVEITDAWLIKDVAGAANTVQLTNTGGTAISDAMAAAVDKTVTRAATLDVATRTLAAAAVLKIVNTRAAGSSAVSVFVKCVRRA